jgi:hypothetical protein
MLKLIIGVRFAHFLTIKLLFKRKIYVIPAPFIKEINFRISNLWSVILQPTIFPINDWNWTASSTVAALFNVATAITVSPAPETSTISRLCAE